MESHTVLHGGMQAREKAWVDYAELICIHSLQNQWRKGYGSKMMHAVLQDIKKAGYTKVMLWVFKDNIRARKFYEAWEFTTDEECKADVVPIEICYKKSL